MEVSISRAVGFQCPNRKRDVAAVQAGLKEAARLTLDGRLDPGPVDGSCGVGTEGAIERFQRRLGMRRPDAQVEPDGYTLRRLNALLAIDSVALTFPFPRSTRYAFHGAGAGMRAFGSRRLDGQRAHAGVDLYYPDLMPVRALADGVVVRAPYYFYSKTYALEIDHGPFIARYGELAPEDSWRFGAGDAVEGSQKIGRVGILFVGRRRLNVPSMMLHLELYDKTETGKLTRALGTSARSPDGIPYRRRRDLIDPTGFLVRAAPR